MVTSWPALARSLGDERADVAAAGDDDAHQWSSFGGPPARCCVEARRWRRRRRRRGRTSPSWSTSVGGRRPGPSPSRVTPTTRAWPSDVEVGDLACRPTPAGTMRSTRHDLGAGVDPLDGGASGRIRWSTRSVVHCDGGDGGDAEALVDRGPAGVVDAGDDPLDPEGLPGDPGHEDVGVVAVGDGGERAGLLDAGGLAGGRGRTRRPTTVRPAKSSGRRLKAFDRRSMTATVWPSSSRRAGQAGTDPPAADDDDVHGAHLTSGARRGHGGGA